VGISLSRPVASFGDARVADRFWEKTQPCPMSGCWLWVGSWTGAGYGNAWSEGKAGVLCHRIFYEALVGPIPHGLQLDHLCRVTCCVNPAHLEPVTNWENTLRGDNNIAKLAKKTHCPKGHPYDEKNTRRRDRGGRECRRCAVIRCTEGRRRKRAAREKSHVV